jgi:nitrite reductase (NADH) large subunit
VKQKILDDAPLRQALWAQLQAALEGEPDPWFEHSKAQLDTRQFTPLVTA